MAESLPAIPLREFAARRQRVLKELKGCVGLVLAGEQDASLHSPYAPHPHFTYLTGLRSEPGAILLLDPQHPVEARRVQLYLRPLNPELEQWDGLRQGISKQLRDSIGIGFVQRTTSFARFLLESARRSRRLACLHPLAAHNAPISPDIAILRESAARIPGCTIVDRSDIITRLRSVKSTAEVSCIRHAGAITALGFEAALQTLRPGISEFDLQEAIEHRYRTNGSRQTAYRTIAGGGVNSTVLHYHANDQPLTAGDLVCIDSGAAFGGYASDVTRTFPVNGQFTKRQRQIYEVVLAALAAATAAVRPGVTIAQVDRAARRVIERAGFGDAFIHGIGHHLGLEVHDSTPDGPLRAGNVITVEPGIYLPAERIGIRIEDDVVVTTAGRSVLTGQIPKSVQAIEAAMRRPKQPRQRQ